MRIMTPMEQCIMWNYMELFGSRIINHNFEYWEVIEEEDYQSDDNTWIADSTDELLMSLEDGINMLVKEGTARSTIKEINGFFGKGVDNFTTTWYVID